MSTLISLIKTYIKFVLLHRWNKVPSQSINLMDKIYWESHSKNGLEYKLYMKIKKLNNTSTPSQN